MQQTARELESNKAELTSENAAARTGIAKLENQLAQETASGRALSEENRILLDHANSADKRIVELEADAALARETLLLLDNDKSSLQVALDQTLGENSRLSRRLTESENALTAARTRNEQTENKLAAAEGDRNKLSAACDEANERRQSEGYTLNLRVEAMRSRAATAETLMAEVRQGFVGRTEEIRVSGRKVVDATVARNATEKEGRVALCHLRGQDRRIKELEQSRATLMERSNSLSETVQGARDLAGPRRDKIKSLSSRVDQLEFDAAAKHVKPIKRIEGLNAAAQRGRMERAVAEGAGDNSKGLRPATERNIGRASGAAARSGDLEGSPTQPSRKSRRSRKTAKAPAAAPRQRRRNRKAPQSGRLPHCNSVCADMPACARGCDDCVTLSRRFDRSTSFRSGRPRFRRKPGADEVIE